MTQSPRFPRTRLAIALGLGVLALGLAGCGEDEVVAGDVEAGASIYITSGCGACHTLADAGTTGSNAINADGSVNEGAGPDLDDAFRNARQVGMAEEQFAGLVKRWIRIAQPPMPRDLVEGQDAEDVAAYIAAVAGRDEVSRVRPAGPPPPQAPVPPRQDIN